MVSTDASYSSDRLNTDPSATIPAALMSAQLENIWQYEQRFIPYEEAYALYAHYLLTDPNGQYRLHEDDIRYTHLTNLAKWHVVKDDKTGFYKTDDFKRNCSLAYQYRKKFKPQPPETYCARLGGDEFAVIRMDADNARVLFADSCNLSGLNPGLTRASEDIINRPADQRKIVVGEAPDRRQAHGENHDFAAVLPAEILKNHFSHEAYRRADTVMILQTALLAQLARQPQLDLVAFHQEQATISTQLGLDNLRHLKKPGLKGAGIACTESLIVDKHGNTADSHQIIEARIEAAKQFMQTPRTAGDGAYQRVPDVFLENFDTRIAAIYSSHVLPLPQHTTPTISDTGTEKLGYAIAPDSQRLVATDEALAYIIAADCLMANDAAVAVSALNASNKPAVIDEQILIETFDTLIVQALTPTSKHLDFWQDIINNSQVMPQEPDNNINADCHAKTIVLFEVGNTAGANTLFGHDACDTVRDHLINTFASAFQEQAHRLASPDTAAITPYRTTGERQADNAFSGLIVSGLSAENIGLCQQAACAAVTAFIDKHQLGAVPSPKSSYPGMAVHTAALPLTPDISTLPDVHAFLAPLYNTTKDLKETGLQYQDNNVTIPCPGQSHANLALLETERQKIQHNIDGLPAASSMKQAMHLPASHEPAAGLTLAALQTAPNVPYACMLPEEAAADYMLYVAVGGR